MKKGVGFFCIELVLVVLMMSGVLPANFSYLIIPLLCLALYFCSNLEFLKFFILSIPIFVVLPANVLSEALSVWRLMVGLWFLKFILIDCGVLSVRWQDLCQKLKNLYFKLRLSNYFSILRWLFILGIISIVSLCWAVDKIAGIKTILFVLNIVILFPLVFYTIRNKSDLKEVLCYLFYALCFILFVGYAQFLLTFLITLHNFWGYWCYYIVRVLYGEGTMTLLSYSNTWFSYYGDDLAATLRMFSVLPDSHSFAMLMILFFPLGVYYYSLQKTTISRIVWGFVLSLIFLAIFFSGSRGAWVGYGVAFIVIICCCVYFKKIWIRKNIDNIQYFNSIKQYKKILLLPLLFICLFPVSAVVLQYNQSVQMQKNGMYVEEGKRRLALLERTKSIYNFTEVSNKGRIQIWQDSVVAIQKKPLLGVGVGNFPVVLGEEMWASKMGSSAHNLYLNVLVELGFIGLLAFMFLLGGVIRDLWLMFGRSGSQLGLLILLYIMAIIWVMAYSFFDVVLLNDKVLMFFVMILAVLYKADMLQNESEKGAVVS